MPLVVKESLADPNSTTGTDQIDSMSTCLRNTEDEKVDKISRKSTKSSKLVLSTPIPIERIEDGTYEWSRFFPLIFDSTCVEKERSITVNLYRTKSNKNKWEKLGRSKTFFLIHLRHQEVKEVMLEFKDSYEDVCDGKVLLRLQYIFNEAELFNEIFKCYEERWNLIMEWLSILERQTEKHREKNSRVPEEMDYGEKEPSYHAGFYSVADNESLLECASSPQKDKLMKQNYAESLCSYDLLNEGLTFMKAQKEASNST
jgi:hypothetical protein